MFHLWKLGSEKKSWTWDGRSWDAWWELSGACPVLCVPMRGDFTSLAATSLHLLPLSLVKIKYSKILYSKKIKKKFTFCLIFHKKYFLNIFLPPPGPEVTSRPDLAALPANYCKISVGFYWVEFFCRIIYGLATPQLWGRQQWCSVESRQCCKSFRAILGVACAQIWRFSGISRSQFLFYMINFSCCCPGCSCSQRWSSWWGLWVSSPPHPPGRRRTVTRILTFVLLSRKDHSVNMIKCGERSDLSSSRYWQSDLVEILILQMNFHLSFLTERELSLFLY